MCGGRHSIIQKENGDILVFGGNEGHQLGLGHNNDVFIPTFFKNDKDVRIIACTYYSTLMLMNNGDRKTNNKKSIFLSNF